MTVIPDQRRDMIVQLLRTRGILSIQELAETLDVSQMTVRRDIALLEETGQVISITGGARIAEHIRSELGYDAKALIKVAEKKAIATKAAQFINDGMSIYLDAGTTVSHMLDHLLTLHDLTIMTNDFTTLAALIGSPFELIHLGGHVDHENRSSVGHLTTLIASKLNIDIAFLSASSWDLAHGVSTPSMAKVDTKRTIMKSSARSFLLADSSKYGIYATFRVAELSEFDLIITDAELPTESAEKIRASQTELIVVQV